MYKTPDTHTNFGSIWVFSGDFTKDKLTNEDVAGKKLEIKNWPSDVGFNPHGMDIHYASKSVYIVNHAMLSGGERVEVFTVNTD